MTTHSYETHLEWSGSTGDGYRAYSRTHVVTPQGAAALTLSADPSFRGDPTLANPEQLLLAAASSCQFLSFAALAARARIDVVGYTDYASAIMPDDMNPIRITEITLRPTIEVRGATEDDVLPLIHEAHEQCFIANSITARISIEPTIRVVDG